MHNAADDAAVIRPVDPAYIRWQMRLNSIPLLIAEPKQILAHDPDHQSPNQTTWNQDCLGSAPELMSFEPSLP
jgi:hypothetical protein